MLNKIEHRLFNKGEKKRYKINISFNEKIPQCRERIQCVPFGQWLPLEHCSVAGDLDEGRTLSFWV